MSLSFHTTTTRPPFLAPPPLCAFRRVVAPIVHVFAISSSSSLGFPPFHSRRFIFRPSVARSRTPSAPAPSPSSLYSPPPPFLAPRCSSDPSVSAPSFRAPPLLRPPPYPNTRSADESPRLTRRFLSALVISRFPSFARSPHHHRSSAKNRSPARAPDTID